jgi:hypothetical protein
VKTTLKILAMLVWYIGFIALALKSYALFAEAYTIDSNLYLLMVILLAGLLLSLLKTRYIFAPACRKNLARIEALAHPRIWQFYRAGFFLFLAGVISLGAWLSHMAAGDYAFLVSVGVVDMALSLALFFSGFVFFEESIKI